MAFGSPFGYVGSMTHGIVSALNRQRRHPGRSGYENFIQVDAPINPGNSGGPLVNLQRRGRRHQHRHRLAQRRRSGHRLRHPVQPGQVRLRAAEGKGQGHPRLARREHQRRRRASCRTWSRASATPATTASRRRRVIKDTPADRQAAAGRHHHRDQRQAGRERSASCATRSRRPRPGTDLKIEGLPRRQDADVTIKIGEQPEDLERRRHAQRRRHAPGRPRRSRQRRPGQQGRGQAGVWRRHPERRDGSSSSASATRRKQGRRGSPRRRRTAPPPRRACGRDGSPA